VTQPATTSTPPASTDPALLALVQKIADNQQAHAQETRARFEALEGKVTRALSEATEARQRSARAEEAAAASGELASSAYAAKAAALQSSHDMAAEALEAQAIAARELAAKEAAEWRAKLEAQQAEQLAKLAELRTGQQSGKFQEKAFRALVTVLLAVATYYQALAPKAPPQAPQAPPQTAQGGTTP
jgi:hypothetical protein